MTITRVTTNFGAGKLCHVFPFNGLCSREKLKNSSDIFGDCVDWADIYTRNWKGD